MNLIITTSLLIVFMCTLVYPLFIAEMSVHVSGFAKSFFIKIAIGLVSILLIPLISNIFNAAIFFYINDLLENKIPSFGRSISMALHKITALIVWSLIQGTVGFFLNLLTSNDNPWVDLIIDLFFGVAWGLISFFVLPIVLFDNKNPFEAIKYSSSMTKSLWGRRGVFRLGVWGFRYLILFWVGIGVVYLGFKLHDRMSFVVVGVGIVYLIGLAYRCRLLTIIIQLKLFTAIKTNEYTTQADIVN